MSTTSRPSRRSLRTGHDGTGRRPPSRSSLRPRRLARLGPLARLTTTVSGIGRLAPGGVWEGNLYLRGEGDPTFGSSAFIRSAYGGKGASVSALAGQLVRVAGIHRVNGSILG